MGRIIILPDDDEPDHSPGAGGRPVGPVGSFGGFGVRSGVSASRSGVALRHERHPDRLEVVHHPDPEAQPGTGARPTTPDAPRREATTDAGHTERAVVADPHGGAEPAVDPDGEPNGEPVIEPASAPEGTPEPQAARAPETEPRRVLEQAPGTPAKPTGTDPETAGPEPHSATDELDELLEKFRTERHRRRSVRAARGLVALFALALLAVWLLDPPLPWGDENRSLTSFPDVSPSGLLSGADTQQTDAALRDRLALRQYVTEAIGEASRDKLGTSLNPAVVLGKNRTPFLSEDFTLPCKYDFDAARTAAGLDRLSSIAAGTGKSIMVAIAPDKSAIMTDALGSRAGALLACANQVRDETEQTWGAQASGPVVTSWDQLQATQDEDPGSVFQKGDSHWSSKGALVWSKTVIDALIARGEAPADLSGAPDAVQVQDEQADNDLYRLMGITKKAMVPVYGVTRDDVTIRAHTEESPSGRGVAVFRAWSTTAPMIEGRTLIVNDSFISRAEGLLAPYFTNLEVMHWSDFLTAVQDDDLPGFDRIIIETVQRGWPQRAGWLQEGQPMYEALAAELGTPIKTDED